MLYSVTVFLLYAVACVAAASDLVITTTFMPETCDRKTVAGDKLAMHYSGYIDESSATGKPGSMFDSSLNRGTPLDFVLGAGRVIKGWDQGLTDMCVGEKRTLIIPPELGYGSRGAGGAIPGGATLKFDVELVSIGVEAPPPNIFAEIDADNDGLITKAEMMEWFARVRKQNIPAGVFEREDANKDGVISWTEFSGPKGEAPPQEL